MSNLEARQAALAERVSTIAARMSLDDSFIAAIFSRLEREYPEEGTAYTNGKLVGFGLAFCEKLTDPELYGVALHEAMHVILLHNWRREGRNPRLFNIATDAVINRAIKILGRTLPEGGIDIPWVTPEMGSEEVYRRLLDEANDPENGQSGDGDGEKPWQTGGGGFDGKGDLADGECQSDAMDVEATVMTAARMAKACGDGSALVEKILGGALEPSVSWVEYLRMVMTSAAKNDYSYRRFSRRMLPAGLFLPTLYSESMGGMVIGVDTSGSVGPQELEQIASEINAIVEDCRPDWVEVVYVDTQVAGTQRFNEGDPIELLAKGGGGTRFAPLFEHTVEMAEPLAAIVYLTDLCGNTMECEDPGVPVIWACTYPSNNDAEVPFGTVVPVIV